MSNKYTLDYSGKEINDLLKKVETTPEISLDGYATEEYVNTEINKIEIPSTDGLATEAYVNTEVAKKTDTNYVNEKVAPKADKTYVDTELDKKADATDLNGLASENYVDTKIATLIDSAPETLDTLGEIAKAIKENDEVVDTLNAAIGNKANKTDVETELAKKANITDIEKLTYNDLPVVTGANLGEVALYIGESGSYTNGAWYQVQDGKNYTVQPTYVGNDVVFNSINTQTFGTKIEALYPSMSSTSNFNLECYPINKAEGLYNLAIVGDKIDTKYATNKELGIVMNVTSKLAMGQTFTRNEAKVTNDFFANLAAGTGDTRARIAETDTGYWIGLSWTHNAEGRKYIKVALNNPDDVETNILWYWHSVNGITYDENYIELPEDFGALHFCPTYDYEQVILDYILIECPYVEIAYSSSSAIVWKLLDEPLTKIEVTSMINTAVTEQINNAITQTLEGSY